MKRLLLLLGFALAAPALAQNPASELSVTCGLTSNLLLQSFPSISYLTIQVPAGNNTVCFQFDGKAATTAPPSFCYTGGTTLTWYNVRDQLVPNGTINCISTPGAQAVAVLYR